MGTLLKNLQVTLGSDDQNTSSFNMAVDFETRNTATLSSSSKTGGVINLVYNVVAPKNPGNYYQNHFVYAETNNWEDNDTLTINVTVNENGNSESENEEKIERDVIKPSDPG